MMPGAFSFSFALSLLFALESCAVQLTIQRPPPKAGTNVNNNLINSNNLRYSTDISVEGQVVNVLIDTGSTDLWVMPPGGLRKFNDTGLSTTLLFGDGSNFVKGDIGSGAFSLGGGEFTVPFQAYLQGTSQAGEDVDFGQGHFGILGLGFDTAGASRINAAVQTAEGAAATWGQSVLSNIFAQNPSGSDYIGVSLSRTGDQEGTADGSLTISEYDSDYESVQNAPKVAQVPPNSAAWTVPLDSFSIGGKKIPWPSTVTAAPAGKNVVLLDTGTTNILMPGAQVNAIYSAIPGAVFAPSARNIPLVQFSTTTDVWVVPCTAQVNIAAKFGGQDFAIHPLDVTDMQVMTTPDGSRNFTVCTNAFTDIGTIASGEADALFGDSFLRNVYTSFDFGTGGPTKGAPFVQMLSQTDATKSAADLINVRRQTMANMPPELTPADFVAVFTGEKDADAVVPVATSTPPPPPPVTTSIPAPPPPVTNTPAPPPPVTTNAPPPPPPATTNAPPPPPATTSAALTPSAPPPPPPPASTSAPPPPPAESSSSGGAPSTSDSSSGGSSPTGNPGNDAKNNAGTSFVGVPRSSVAGLVLLLGVAITSLV
ncbi:aspartic peptidase domain-containing protein [Mycena capillaripes]|nr:aspartic peptidase domain-containing protein [Mycena capillaripes]